MSTETEQPTAQTLWDAEIAERSGESQADYDNAEQVNESAEQVNDAAAGTPSQASLESVQLAQAQASLAQLQQQFARETGRTSALQKKINELERAAPSREQVAAAIEDPAEWKQLQADFPDWAVGVSKKIDLSIQSALKTLAPAAPALDEGAVDGAVSKALRDAEFARVDRRFPNWRDTINTPDFTRWFNEQPESVRAQAESPYSEDALDLLNAYTKRGSAAKAVSLNERREATRQAATGAKTHAAPGDARAQALSLWDAELRARQAQAKRYA